MVDHSEVLLAFNALTASQIRFGLVLADLLADVPPSEHLRALKYMGEHFMVWGAEPLSMAEVSLLMSIAKRGSHLAKPEAIDLDNPQHVEVIQSLGSVFKAVGDRAHQRAYANT